MRGAASRPSSPAFFNLLQKVENPIQGMFGHLVLRRSNIIWYHHIPPSLLDHAAGRIGANVRK
jgi:hypothetical protein